MGDPRRQIPHRLHLVILPDGRLLSPDLLRLKGHLPPELLIPLAHHQRRQDRQAQQTKQHKKDPPDLGHC